MYKIFDDLDSFYAWQGYDEDPADGTVNKVLWFSIENPNTYRYSYPYPNGTATYEKDAYGMPFNITGDDIRVCTRIDDECPDELMPNGLVSLDEVKSEGWFNE